VTPTSFAVKTQIAGHAVSSQTPAIVLGSLMHAVLSNITYANILQPVHQIIEQTLDRDLPAGFQTERAVFQGELESMLSTFMQSEVYAELCASTIVGREIPFLMPFKSPSRHLPTGLMEGRIDLVYRKDGRLWLADYKTDRVTEAEMAGRAQAYDGQAQYYMQAVRDGVGEEPVGFKVIFVRLGKALHILPPS